MNRDKACLHPLVWPDVCGHGDGTYVGTVVSGHVQERWRKVQDVYVYERDDGHPLVCVRSGSVRYQYHHIDLGTFWLAAAAYPHWHPARDLLLSQGFAP